MSPAKFRFGGYGWPKSHECTGPRVTVEIRVGRVAFMTKATRKAHNNVVRAELR